MPDARSPQIEGDFAEQSPELLSCSLLPPDKGKFMLQHLQVQYNSINTVLIIDQVFYHTSSKLAVASAASAGVIIGATVCVINKAINGHRRGNQEESCE